MTVPNLTSQHIDFNEWLEQCPVEWFKSAKPSVNGSATYEFFFDAVKEEDS
jgi:hypothetical protein